MNIINDKQFILRLCAFSRFGLETQSAPNTKFIRRIEKCGWTYFSCLYNSQLILIPTVLFLFLGFVSLVDATMTACIANGIENKKKCFATEFFVFIHMITDRLETEIVYISDDVGRWFLTHSTDQWRLYGSRLCKIVRLISSLRDIEPD